MADLESLSYSPKTETLYGLRYSSYYEVDTVVIMK